MVNYRIDFEAIPWESPIEGLRQKVHRVGGRQLRLVEYSKALPPTGVKRGTSVCLQGQIEIRFDGQTQVYGPGDGVFIPDGRNTGTWAPSFRTP